MTVLWFFCWLMSNTPKLHEWNNWLLALIVCIIIDLSEGSRHGS